MTPFHTRLNKTTSILAAGGFLMTSMYLYAQPATALKPSYANHADQAKQQELMDREADWRNGAIVYQVIVDRFAPPANLEAKRDLYPAPKTLHEWTENPAHGEFVEETGVWSHEIAFWGGDLQSLTEKLGYIDALGADVLYLNPIALAYTNHKYDTQDYFEVSPEYGTRADVATLADNLHERGMKLVLDGVFNHMGATSPIFQDALENESSPWRDWFYFGDQYEFGYRGWANVSNLPELNMENPAVRARIFGEPDSVIQGYLRDGVDGWRLDVAFDLGFVYLNDLTRGAHTARSGSLVIGEIWNYPEEWMPSLDAVMNMTSRQLVLDLLNGKLSGRLAGKHLERMVEDTGIEPLLKSWVMLDNHDTERLNSILPEEWQQRMAQTLQFSMPGSPCVYYGVELGMEGGQEPECRGPMRWDLVNDENEQLQFFRQLVEMRRKSRALKIGDFRLLDSDALLAFMRTTDRAEETRVVVANPTAEPVSEVLLVRDSKIMNGTEYTDVFSGKRFKVMAGLMAIEVPAQTAMILTPNISRAEETYTPYKRVQ